MIFGLVVSDSTWDILQNPFVEFKGHMISTGMKISNSLELHICSDEEKLRFVPESNFYWYP